jgi:hypothetical protein
MNVFERSWSITKMSFDVVRKDPELLLFPAISGFFSTIFTIAMLFPSFIAVWIEGGDVVFGPLQMATTFASYFGLAFFATFSNVCVVHTTRTRLNGGDATFGESIRFAMTRLPQIAGWSAVSASVGVLLRLLDNAARRSRGIGRIIAQILHSILGLAWSVVSLFVVPAMVYDNIGPIDALQRSIEVLKRTWGESLIRHYGMGLMTFLFALPGAALILFGIFAFEVSGALAVLLLVAGGLWIFAAVFFFGLLNAVYNTALFHYATQGNNPPQGFDPSVLRAAFGQRRR